ncbi:hypothetical protein [Croceitalea rosinachiae]|uniref:Lipoprotein n=1 Tax=Croceitalea rosinachiae TaxID=3075596 RepID=A0ABU3A626_9FLAO|nr:hypothetical protein [Croceitalea sp. F388]MDT0605414.1 hypothetical protein [Croceitalea sp. F388]
MKRLVFFFKCLLIALISSCSNDDDDDDSPERNSFSYGGDTYEVDKAYYVFEGTDFTYQEFLIVLTDGSIESFSIPTNDFVFGPETKNVILIRARTFDDKQASIGRLPTGNFVYSVPFGMDSLDFLRLQHSCETFGNQDSESCLEIKSLPFIENSSGKVEINSNTSNNSYEIKLEIIFSEELFLSGTYSGPILTFNK